MGRLMDEQKGKLKKNRNKKMGIYFIVLQDRRGLIAYCSVAAVALWCV